MSPMNKNFKGQLDDERVVCVFRRHWIGLLPHLLSIPLLFFVIFLVFYNLPNLMREINGMDFLLVLGMLVLHGFIHRQFLIIFKYYLQTVVLTDRRVVIVEKSVYFKDLKTSIDLVNIQDIQKHQAGFLETFFDYGSLVFMLSGSGSSMTIDLVPRPEYQYKKINEVKHGVQGNAKMAG